MGCAASNDDSHQGMKFCLTKWLTPDEVKALDSEQAERDAFLKCVKDTNKIGTGHADLDKMTNDELVEAFGPYFWLIEQHYLTPQELSGMTHVQIKAEAASKSRIDGNLPTYEFCQKLAEEGTCLNINEFRDKSLKSAAVFALVASPSEASSMSAADLKAKLNPMMKDDVNEATDEELFNAAIAIGALRGLGLVPDDKLPEMEKDKQRMALVPAAMKADDAGLAKAMEYKDKCAWDLATSLPNTKKSIALQPFVQAYKPETEEGKKKKEEARAKKAAEKK